MDAVTMKDSISTEELIMLERLSASTFCQRKTCLTRLLFKLTGHYSLKLHSARTGSILRNSTKRKDVADK